MSFVQGVQEPLQNNKAAPACSRCKCDIPEIKQDSAKYKYTSIIKIKLVNSSFTVQWRGIEFGIVRKKNGKIFFFVSQEKPPYSTKIVVYGH